MTRLALMLAACIALAAPAFALDYDCSPLTGGCVPRASQPSVFDSPYPRSNYVPRSYRDDRRQRTSPQERGRPSHRHL
jgi:hypothetical protein